AALGGQRQREEPVDPFGSGMELGQRAAGFHGDGVAGGIDRANPLHAGEREHHVARAVVRGGGAGQARVAALGHDRVAVLRAPAHHGGDTLGVVRHGDGERPSAIPAAPVHEHGRDRVVVDQEPPPEGGGQGFARGTLGLGAHRMPGSMPFMPRIILASPPFCMRFIMVCICSNCLSRRLTSCTGTPAPAAMRRLREALIVSGRLRSDGVMAWMIPCMRRIWRSAWLMSAPAAACWNWAGSLSRSDPRPPILFIWPSWARKSLRSKRLPDLSLSASWRAAAWSTFRWASSTSETMSPMPRM